MKISQKLILGFFIIILLMAIFGYFTIIRLNRISVISREVREATVISQAVLDFNVENFHTQLEVWEYVFEPNEKRLEAFNEHNDKLARLLDELVEQVEEEGIYRAEHSGEAAGIYEGGLEEVKTIQSNLEKVRNGWILLIEKIKEIRSLEDAGYREGSEQYEIIKNELKMLALANEELFDELDFNLKVDEFVVVQEGVVRKLNAELENLVSQSKIMLVTVMSILFVLGAGIALLISRSISGPIIKLRDATKKIGEGKLNTQIKIKSKDEIGQLGISFNRMAENLHRTTVSKDYVDNIIESMEDALVVINPNANIRSVNRSTCDLLGYTEEELVGRDVSLMFVEEEGLFKGTRLQKLMEKGSLRDYAMNYRTKNGESIPVSFSGSVMKDKDDKLLGVVGVARDMREMKKLFEKEKELACVATNAAEAEKKKSVELENANRELEKSQDKTLNFMEELQAQRNAFEKQYQETKQKSKSLEQAQAASLNIMEDLDLKRKEVEEREKKLKETQAMLVQAGKLSAMGQLGAGIAHELNQPLAAIRGYTQVLIEEIKDNDPHFEDLKIIEEQTDRMGTIVNNIRSFARDSKFTWELIDIHKPLEDAFMLLTTQLTNHNIEVVKDYGQDIPQINADGNQLQQVFINLISNARDALNKNNGGKIWVSTRMLKLGKQKTDWKISISIKNDGTPIPEEIIDQIFDPFFTTKDSGKGTGLGLSISYGIIKDHQGEIAAVNKEDGVEFVINLPIDAKGKNAKDI